VSPTRISQPTAGGRDPSAAWLFPELVMSLAPVSATTVVLPAGVPTKFLTRNPRRIGLVVMTAVVDAVQTYVSPFDNPNLYGIPIPTSTRVVSFAVDDLYSLVGQDWYGYNSAGGTILVAEFVRPA